MILLELNEFNPGLLKQYADKFDLDHIHLMLDFQHTCTHTNDQEERYGLDPWVQWVSIHTGQDSQVHGIKHLGDIDQLPETTLQLWDSLYKQYGMRFSVWGAMNASYLKSDGCDNFFPDPWTFTVAPYPGNLSGLMAFPRFYAKNYLDLKQIEFLTSLVRTTGFFLHYKNWSLIPKMISKSLKAAIQIGVNTNALFSVFDTLNTELFIRRAKDSDFKVLFLNSIAHLQHHCWNNEEDNRNISFCLQNLNSILGTIFKHFPDEPIIITNAFRQIQSYENREFLYRQKSPERFLKQLDINFTRIEQLMTNDSHVFFDNINDMTTAYKILSSVTVANQEAMYIEKDEQNLKLFMQFKLWNNFPEGSVMRANNKTYRLYDHFEKVVRRTGTHISTGDIYSQGIDLPQKMLNHELANYIHKHFQAKYDHSHSSSV